jgi:prolyl 4-hydroxylase
MENTSNRATIFESVSNRLQSHEEIYGIKGSGLDLYLLRNFLTEEECKLLIYLVNANNRPSTILGNNADLEFRTSVSSPLGNCPHDCIRSIDARICLLLGIDPSLGECLEGQRYSVGQQFKPHHDYFQVNERYWLDQEGIGGQRTWTVVLCLMAPDIGGGTLFPEAGVRITPRQGNLLAWCNVNRDGSENYMSLHCGEPVEKGFKYIATKWFRERPIQM